MTANAIAITMPSGTPTYSPIFESDLFEADAPGSDVAGGAVEELVKVVLVAGRRVDVLVAVATKSGRAAVA